MKRDPIEDRWKSTLWENNPELLEYTSSLERKLKIAEEALEHILECWNRDRNDVAMHDACWEAINTADGALSAIRKE